MSRWPAGLLDAPMGRLGGLTCPVIGVAAQIEIKEMMPVWVPGLPRREKDMSDLARLRMHVRLREVRDSDLETFHVQEKDPEATRRSRFPARERERFLAHWRERILPDETCHVRTVEVGGEIAGNVVAWWEGDHRYLGYWLGREFWGSGVGTRALTLFLEEEKVRPLYADPHGGQHGLRPSSGETRLHQEERRRRGVRPPRARAEAFGVAGRPGSGVRRPAAENPPRSASRREETRSRPVGAEGRSAAAVGAVVGGAVTEKEEDRQPPARNIAQTALPPSSSGSQPHAWL